MAKDKNANIGVAGTPSKGVSIKYRIADICSVTIAGKMISKGKDGLFDLTAAEIAELTANSYKVEPVGTAAVPDKDKDADKDEE